MEAATAPAVTPLRERLKNVKPFTSEIVAVPEWDGEKIEVRSMSVARKTQMVTNATDAAGDVDERALMPELVIACSFDPDTGSPVFSDSDAVWLGDQNAAAVERLATVGMRLSGMDVAAAVDEGKDGS